MSEDNKAHAAIDALVTALATEYHIGLRRDGNLMPVLHEIERTKPGHGPCCTCQRCGYHHDECVCGHNEIVQIVEHIKARFA